MQLLAGAGEELGVLRHRPRPAAFDECHTEFVEQAGDRELVRDRIREALALGPVAERGIEHLDRHRVFPFANVLVLA